MTLTKQDADFMLEVLESCEQGGDAAIKAMQDVAKSIPIASLVRQLEADAKNHVVTHKTFKERSIVLRAKLIQLKSLLPAVS